ncbi:hypothetical protein, partial [Methanosarcina mazei]
KGNDGVLLSKKLSEKDFHFLGMLFQEYHVCFLFFWKFPIYFFYFRIPKVDVPVFLFRIPEDRVLSEIRVKNRVQTYEITGNSVSDIDKYR